MNAQEGNGVTEGPRRPQGDAPRMRDLPKPRRSPSFIGPLFRTLFAWPYRFALAGLFRAGLHPWQLTLLSVVATGVGGWLIVTGRFFIAGLMLVVSGLLDVFDGGLARL